MAKASPYSPSSLTSAEVRRAAFRCGLELPPNSVRSGWIDDLEGELALDAIVAYHEGELQKLKEEMR